MPHLEMLVPNMFLQLPSGLDVAPLTPSASERVVISDRAEHCYYCYYLESGQRVVIDHLACASVFLPSVENTLEEITVNKAAVPVGGSALLENMVLEIVATKGSGYVLVAGSRQRTPNAPKSLVVHTADQHYVVNKPWGHELWINGEHPVFSFKEVFIKKGFQTSLQYHNYKIEAALLYAGVCDIVYKRNDNVSNDEVQPEDLAVAQLAVMGKICVDPGTLHRMRAATDMYHYEVSTPHLDDVVRVQDDNKRGHGRIQAEHMSA
jgi:mannose-6-phosphate isomerase